MPNKKEEGKIHGKFVRWNEHEPWMHSTLKQMAAKNFFTQSANKVSNMFPCIFRTKLLYIFGERALGSHLLRLAPLVHGCAMPKREPKHKVWSNSFWETINHKSLKYYITYTSRMNGVRRKQWENFSFFWQRLLFPKCLNSDLLLIFGIGWLLLLLLLLFSHRSFRFARAITSVLSSCRYEMRERFSSLTRFLLLINLLFAQYCINISSMLIVIVVVVVTIIIAIPANCENVRFFHWFLQLIGDMNESTNTCARNSNRGIFWYVCSTLSQFELLYVFGVFACISLYTCIYLCYEIETRRTSRQRRRRGRRWRRQNFSPSLLLFNFRTDRENNETEKQH